MKKSLASSISFTLLIFLFLFTGIDSYSQQYWRKISKPVNCDLWKCYFLDTLNGWAVGDSGTIIHTTNGGYNWVLQNSKLKDRINCIFFLNNRLGWALSWGMEQNFYGTFILKTTNGGAIWDTTRYPANDVFIWDIIFIDSLTGYICGNPGIFHKTTNGGTNWTKCNLDTTIAAGFPARKFKFFNNKIGIAVGGVFDIAGIIWKTTNYGQFWTADIVAPEPINDIKLFDSLNYLAIGGDYEYGASVLRTTNGGLNWNYKTLELYGIPRALSFRTNTEGWAPMGYLPDFIMTTDKGVSWSVKDTPDSTEIFDLTFKNSNFGIGVGLSGHVLKYYSKPTFSVSGTVKYNDNNQYVTTGTVKAFTLDKSSGNIVVLDSAQIQSDGTYKLNNVPQDSVDIGVFPNSTPPNDWVITFYPSTIYWQEATVLYPTGNLNDIEVRAIRLTSTNANNSVNGKIMRQQNYVLENIKDAYIYAKNGNSFVRCTMSDENGVYHLQSLPAGNLTIIATRFGFSSDSSIVNVTLTSNIDSVNFYLNRIFIGIKPIENSVPSEFKIFQNYPNPFNSMTNIRWQMSNAENAKITIYDVLGREVITLINEKLQVGTYQISFDAGKLASGIYFYKLIAGDFIETKRMVLLK